jgi:putative transposase
MRYRRSNVAGGTFFFTVNLADRSSGLLTERVDLLRNSIRKVRQSHPFNIVAMVVLPDHLHAIWEMPDGDNDYPLRWSLIKAGFSRALEKTEYIGNARRRKRERGIWQRRYWEHQLRSDTDLARHVDYIHINPVKHGHVNAPVEWPYTSLHRYIQRGLLLSDWATGNDLSLSGYGERE